jgi:heat shock protein HtpX
MLAVLGPTRLPLNVLMRMRKARPLHPAEAGWLYGTVGRLARRAGLPHAPHLYLQHSAELQAFAAVSGRASGIAVTPALLRALGPRQLEGVLAHELSHIKSGDTKLMGLARAMRSLTHTLATLAWVLLGLALLFPSTFNVSLSAVAVLVVAPTFSYLVELALSRAREYDADLAAARLTGHPDALASALYKLEQHQSGLLAALVGFTPRLSVPHYLKTHPPTRERVRRLLELRAHTGGDQRPKRFVSYAGMPATNVRWSVMTL